MGDIMKKVLVILTSFLFLMGCSNVKSKAEEAFTTFSNNFENSSYVITINGEYNGTDVTEVISKDSNGNYSYITSYNKEVTERVYAIDDSYYAFTNYEVLTSDDEVLEGRINDRINRLTTQIDYLRSSVFYGDFEYKKDGDFYIVSGKYSDDSEFEILIKKNGKVYKQFDSNDASIKIEIKDVKEIKVPN